MKTKNELGAAVKINADKNQSFATKLQVLFKKIKQRWKQSGVLQKNDLVAIINSHK